MTISRMRSSQHKVYIPASVRENQYLLAKFTLTDEFINQFSGSIDEKSATPYQDFYQRLSTLFFTICNEVNIESCHFVGNDKFTRVRYSPEKLTAQTEQQIVFLYNPLYHVNQNSYFDGSKKARKISLVFLTNSEDIRADAAKFHQKVAQALTRFAQQTALAKDSIRVCDHQHLTYDLFAKDKGITGTQTHKLRTINVRYKASNVELPATADSLSYVTVELPINKRIKQLAAIDESSPEPYNGLYNLIADAFIHSAKKHELNNGAVIANGLVPFVRTSDDDIVVTNGELQKLGFNPEHTTCGYTCKWSADKLVDSAQLIFIASNKNQTSHGHGKFLSQVEKALRSMAEKLEYINDKEELKVRFHQHIAYNV
ncbi:DUF3083 family protein [Colwelliaceae bacterium 6441]